MNKKDSFETDDRECPYCKSAQFYSMEYDAYFCEKCDKWLESNCKDPECKFCVSRPKKPLSKESNAENRSILVLVKELSSRDVNLRKKAAREIREAAEEGLDISKAISILLKLLNNEKANDVLYDYIYTDPEEMSDYEKYLDVYESFLALRNFVRIKKPNNLNIFLREVKKARIDESLWWIKSLLKGGG